MKSLLGPALALLAALAVPAQGMPGVGGPGMGMGGMGMGMGMGMGRMPGMGAMSRPGGERSSFLPNWAPPPRQLPFRGFRTVVAPQLRAFGGYPLEDANEAVAAALGGLPVLPFAVHVAEAPDWPRWVRDRSVEPLPFVPEQALLLRHADRVWWRSPGEDAAVPLYHHDKVRSVVAGTAIEVRQSGELELLLHLGGQIMSQGPVQLQIAALDAERVELHFAMLTKLRLQVSGREHLLRLPDGSTLRIPSDAAAAEDLGGPAGHAQLQFDRLEGPSRQGGRIALWNAGERPVLWRHAFGELWLQRGEQVHLLVEPSPHRLPATMESTGLPGEVVGAQRRWLAQQATEVRWSGARFELPAGASLQLDPLQGDPFAAAKPETPAN